MISVKDLKNFDPAEYLESDEDIAIFLDEAFKSGSAKHKAFSQCLGNRYES